ncbi:MAG: cytochrome c1 [Epsilonproteobacteria bacterium]|nr:MAG: cytochrome c1 [Campylobacterota bacterium]
MRELKIFAVVVFFSLLTYYLVEPYAHHQMHMKVDKEGNEIHIESHGFTYDGTDDIAEAERKGDAALVTKKKAFWSKVVQISKIKGDVVVGEASFALCLGCHNNSNFNMGGAIPPNLDHVGGIYDKNYLIALIKDPAMAGNVDHKYKDTIEHPMGRIQVMMTEDQQIADVVAYMLAEKAGEVTPKEAFNEACVRCHAVRYKKVTQLGDVPKFKYKKDQLAYEIKVIEEQDMVKAYMGNLPPDLSMMIRARSEHFLETFTENPQGQLPGTSMPRVGLNAEGYEKVKTYLTEAGDPSKKAREQLGPWVIGFFVIFTILAFLWKKSMWRDHH